MEDSSHSTPSPMSSAASSQDSLNRSRANAAHLAALQAAHAQQQQQNMDYYGAYGGSGMAQGGPTAAQMMMMGGPGAPGGKKNKGVKSTLGRIFGKKDKQLKAMKVKYYFPVAFWKCFYNISFCRFPVAPMSRVPWSTLPQEVFLLTVPDPTLHTVEAPRVSEASSLEVPEAWEAETFPRPIP